MNRALRYPVCDIVVIVGDLLTQVKDCLNSISLYTPPVRYRFILIDNCSDPVVQEYLQDFPKKDPTTKLLRNSQPEGISECLGKGLSLSESDNLVFIESCVIVTPQWLERLRNHIVVDHSIAAVCPLSNYSFGFGLPPFPGGTVFTMDWFLRSGANGLSIEVQEAPTSCVLIRRAAFNEAGSFHVCQEDSSTESSGAVIRFAEGLYSSVLACDLYVLRNTTTSHVVRKGNYSKEPSTLDSTAPLDNFRRLGSDILDPKLAKVFKELSPSLRWSPVRSMRATYRSVRKSLRESKPLAVVSHAWRGLPALWKARRPRIDRKYLEKFTRPDRLRITYVLHNLTIAGGVLSVVQLVNELVLLGVDARIATLRDYPEVYDWKFFSQPIVYSSVGEMIRNFPESDIAVATHWTTAPWVAEIAESGIVEESAYFIQDYESWFYPEEEQNSRARVKETYGLIGNRIVKSDWLRDLLNKDGYDAVKIPIGLDLGMFYSRPVECSPGLRILAMARPRTPRRGFKNLVEALVLVKEKVPGAEFVFFGEDLVNVDIPFEFRNESVISGQSYLAELYSSADIFVDASDFQGFGRSALEAMACGTACVLTNVGGVSEYAEHQSNCLLAPPRDSEKLAAAVVSLAEDDEQRKALGSAAVETAKGFCHKREAQETLSFFRKIVHKSDSDR